jgi:signal transduction histidine kinase/ActR/RegA family two-component response regulator
VPFLLTGIKFEAQGQRYLMGIGFDITERMRAEAEAEKLQAQLTQVQKMESVGRLAGGIAHDFNNMLGVILGYSELALGQVKAGQPLHSALQGIQQAAQRSAELTRQLLAFARKQTVAPKVLDLNETMASMLNMLRRLIGENIDLAWLPGEGLGPIKMDPTQIDQILANLCVNARDAIGDTGKVTIETNNIVFDEAYCAAHAGFVPGEYVLLALSDNGCGMDRETLSHLFEPFFTTKEMGQGTGLGLATVYGIVKQNNGFINVYSEPGLGTTFKLYLPLYMAKGEQRSPEPEAAKPAVTGHETILLVEDEPMILEMTTLMLTHQGYTVLPAVTPGEAIRLAREHAGEIHLLMTDVVMPEMNGRDLARNLLSLYPDLKRLFMSGYTANVIAHHGVLDEGVNFIQKPFTMQDLAAKIRNVLVDEELH